jgi:hypothetical protein
MTARLQEVVLRYERLENIGLDKERECYYLSCLRVCIPELSTGTIFRALFPRPSRTPDPIVPTR